VAARHAAEEAEGCDLKDHVNAMHNAWLIVFVVVQGGLLLPLVAQAVESLRVGIVLQ
jgi:hypothetical protein